MIIILILLLIFKIIFYIHLIIFHKFNFIILNLHLIMFILIIIILIMNIYFQIHYYYFNSIIIILFNHIFLIFLFFHSIIQILCIIIKLINFNIVHISFHNNIYQQKLKIIFKFHFPKNILIFVSLMFLIIHHLNPLTIMIHISFLFDLFLQVSLIQFLNFQSFCFHKYQSYLSTLTTILLLKIF